MPGLSFRYLSGHRGNHNGANVADQAKAHKYIAATLDIDLRVNALDDAGWREWGELTLDKHDRLTATPARPKLAPMTPIRANAVTYRRSLYPS